MSTFCSKMSTFCSIRRCMFIPMLVLLSLLLMPIFNTRFSIRSPLETSSSVSSSTAAINGGGNETKCDLFNGKWVLDNESRPLYREEECGFFFDWVACLKHGRRDSLYQKWRWQPSHCSLPNKIVVGETKGKRLMYVGDSVHYNQWQSMVCLLQSMISSTIYGNSISTHIYAFKLQEYNASIEFYWAPFLVESNADPPTMRDGRADPVIMADSITKHGDYWKTADYLVFNSFAWWLKYPNMKLLRGSFDEGAKEYDEIEHHIAYERVLKTWANWAEENIDFSRTMVFFSSTSPTHERSSYWKNNPDGGKCEGETLPILDMNTTVNVGTDWKMFDIVVNVTRSIKKHVYFLNITTLFEFRKDAHPSVYTEADMGKLGEISNTTRSNVDCLHWCLPGLPDTWNELLYAYIISYS